MRFRRLNERGLTLTHQWLDQMEQARRGEVPRELLEGSDLTEVFLPELEFEPRRFDSRFEWACYSEQLLRSLPGTELQRDTGLWAWLTLALFDSVCPPDGDGKRKVGHRARYVPSGNDFRTYYRHLLEGPWRIARAHRDNPQRARGVLMGTLDKPGEIAEQLSSRQELVSSSTVMAVTTSLYVDPGSAKPKRGAGGAGPGSPRRLAEILAQFDLTHDIYAMEPTRLVAILPNEFNRFRSTGT